jgi:inhibitor of KinA
MGDRGVLVAFGDSVSQTANQKVYAMEASILQSKIEGVIDTIPGYCSLAILYNPLRLSFKRLQETVMRLNKKLQTVSVAEPAFREIPVEYGGEHGPDLDYVAGYHSLSVEEVIRIHSSVTYNIYVLGTTGFAYLGELPEELHTPRLQTPRPKVAAGSVGIGNNQTGIYAVEGPSGWQIIGRTSMKIYDAQMDMPVLLKPNQRVKFIPQSREARK